MSFEDLAGVDIVRGLLSLIFIIASLLVGSKLISKYFQYKRKSFITIGLTWIFLTASWWHSTINIFLILVTGNPLNPLIGIILMNFFIAPALWSWLYSITTLMYEKVKKKIMIASSLILFTYEIILILFLFLNPNLIGEVVSDIIIRRTSLTLTVAIIAVIIAVITGVLMSLEAIKSSNDKIKWKGRFLLFAFILFFISALLDSLSWDEIFIVIILRTMLIISAICYYLGFFLSDRIANILIKEN